MRTAQYVCLLDSFLDSLIWQKLPVSPFVQESGSKSEASDRIDLKSNRSFEKV